MKRTLVAILALSPVLAFAQTNQPAQPRSTPLLASTLVQPASLHAAVLADSPAKNSSRVSTGVTAPLLIHTASFNAPQDSISKLFRGIDQKVVVNMTVDETGKPVNLSIVKSSGVAIDNQVLATVSQYRYQPATLDGQPTAVPVKLEVLIPAGSTY